MTAWVATVLAQCPCSDGGSGSQYSSVSTWLILAVALGTWLLARFVWKKRGASTMGKIGKITVVVVLAIAVVAVIIIKKGSVASSQQSSSPTASGLPRLVDLGSTTCIPCKMMAPVLDDLGKEYAGRMQVEFINVNDNADAAKPYGIKLIPTQVFLDANGKEMWRHEGFISKQDILAKWQELGVSFTAASVAVSQPTSAPK